MAHCFSMVSMANRFEGELCILGGEVNYYCLFVHFVKCTC